MEVRETICAEMLSKLWDERVALPFVTSRRGMSGMSFGTGMVCKASMVAEGGVCSPRIGRTELVREGLAGVGVAEREPLRSAPKKSLDRSSFEALGVTVFNGRSGEEDRDPSR